ncbi:MAG: hypothetical protein NVSMB38_45860 [Ktedonobacteraceae bacterium]
MQNGSRVSLGTESMSPDCVFCQRSAIAANVLKETPNFRLVVDQQYYIPPIFWEHGVFHQTVFHAHLHCFPFGILGQKEHALCQQLCAEIVQDQDAIRSWYASQGHYFYLEPDKAFLFAPENDKYMRIIQGIFWPKVSALNNQKVWHSSFQRQKEGKARTEATCAKWRLFEQQGVTYANEASA